MGCFTSIVYKIIILAFNVLIVCGASALIAYGVRYTETASNGVNIFGEFLFGVVAIVVGGVALIVIIVGCIGAWFEQSKLLRIYGGILMGLFVVQLSLGIMAISKIQNPVGFANDVNAIMEYLFEDDPARFGKIQNEFKCCGVNGFSDYNSIYPATCCENAINPCLTPFEEGCALTFRVVIEEYIKTIGYLAVFFAIIKLMGACFALIPRKKVQTDSDKEDNWY